jgi:hypothetical protein
MRSKQLNFNLYDTDKIEAGYLSQYDQVFSDIYDNNLKILELGIRNGGSLLLWKDYFPKGNVAGIDIKLPVDFKPEDRISLHEGSQADTVFLGKVSEQVAPEGFNIIIDDASHIGELTKKSFWYLFDNHLQEGGIYVIEDWGTGYWNDWPDGKSFAEKQSAFSKVWIKMLLRFNILRHVPIKNSMYSHNFGMVGFIKSLVDEQGASDLTRRAMKEKPGRGSKFEKMIITPHIVFIYKRKETEL